MLRINAGLLARQMTEALHRPVHAFNFAAPLQTVAFNERLLHDILLKMNKPGVIVFGLMPINLLQDERPEYTASLVRNIPVFTAHDGTLSGRVYAALVAHVYLIRYRELVRDRLFLPSTAQPDDEWIRMAHNTDALGDIPFEAPDAPVAKLTEWEHDYQRDFRRFDEIMRTT
jgi:hypothetical protein